MAPGRRTQGSQGPAESPPRRETRALQEAADFEEDTRGRVPIGRRPAPVRPTAPAVNSAPLRSTPRTATRSARPIRRALGPATTGGGQTFGATVRSELVIAASFVRPSFAFWPARARVLSAPTVRPAVISPTSVRPTRTRPPRGQTTPPPQRQVIQHIVLFNPKGAMTEEDRRSFARTVIDSLSGSPDVSRVTIGRRADVDAGYERVFGDKAYEYAAVLECVDRPALVRYLNSPNHAELGRLFWWACDSTVVCEVEVVDVVAPDAVDRLVLRPNGQDV
jgi:hypothetical protein